VRAAAEVVVLMVAAAARASNALRTRRGLHPRRARLHLATPRALLATSARALGQAQHPAGHSARDAGAAGGRKQRGSRAGWRRAAARPCTAGSEVVQTDVGRVWGREDCWPWSAALSVVLETGIGVSVVREAGCGENGLRGRGVATAQPVPFPDVDRHVP
jgi:hypothetical protein